MLFGYFTLFVALLIEVVGAYYSITGLAAIFSGAVIPILIMGGSLELGKVTAAVWLKQNWERASLTFKLYLLPAVVMLMFITSMGIFGFLSKAHNDQNLVSGDVQSKIAIYDEKIKIQKDNIESARKALQQMDAAVDQTMARSTNEQGADKATAIRRGQARERTNLQNEISRAQGEIVKLNDLRAPIAAEVRKVEAEVGPIKYIAKLIYDENPDANILEKAVVWVIIMIVAVFDPLALVLILAAQQSIRWARSEDQEEEVKLADATDSPVTKDYVDNLEPVFDPVELPEEYFQDPEPEEELPVVKKARWAGFGFPMSSVFGKPKEEPVVEHIVAQPVAEVLPELVVEEPTPAPVVQVAPENIIHTIGDDYIEINGKRMHHKAFDPHSTDALHAAERHIENTQPQFDIGLEEDNLPNSISGTMRGFGTSFPLEAVKGDMFLRVDQLPSALYKFNGTQWIRVDKSMSDQYAYNDAYIDHLIEKISTGEYDLDLLSDAERSSIEYRLNNKQA